MANSLCKSLPELPRYKLQERPISDKSATDQKTCHRTVTRRAVRSKNPDNALHSQT